MRSIQTLRVAVLMFAALFAVPTQAQAPFPSRPIKLLVTIPPGGAPDIAARLLSQFLQESPGWSVVIENRTGANGNIAAAEVAKAPPDGYTLLLGADSGITINPHVYANLPFDPLKDLGAGGELATNQFMMSAHPDLPIKTFQDFIEYARKTKPPLPIASGGNGSQHHLGMEMLKQRAGIDLLHVPFRARRHRRHCDGKPPTPGAVLQAPSAFRVIRSGQLRGLAASGKHRSKRFPNLPTVGEFYPGVEIDIWLGLFAPPGTPEPVLTTLRTEVNKLLARPDFAEKLNVSGSLEPLILSPPDPLLP